MLNFAFQANQFKHLIGFINFNETTNTAGFPSGLHRLILHRCHLRQFVVLVVSVVGCNKLRDLEWISRQDPYVYVEYGGAKHRTETCTDGGKNPTFQQKFAFVLIEGLRELNLTVWNSNTLSYDNFIGNGKVHLHKVLSEGYDDSYWPLQTKTGRYAGEVHLIVHYANANKAATSLVPSAPPLAPSAPPCVAPATPQVLLLYAAPPPASVAPYPLQTTAYAVQSRYPSYPPPPYPPPHPATYPPPPYSTPVVYPPPPYPPPPQASPYHPPGPYHGSYPPRQY
ncbi:hypothetical protein L1049_014970 [Liquidambar formosana]|uniref:C2 domain-containing protein n=1 Tax=Liquidambar formosana TaxID=63359 RepID=A0AAP0X266_LIQFO